MNAVFIVVISSTLLALVCSTFGESTLSTTTLSLANETETETLGAITQMTTKNEISVENTTASTNQTDMFEENGNWTTLTEEPHNKMMNTSKILDEERVKMMSNDTANVDQSTTTMAIDIRKTSMENTTEVLTSTSDPSNSQKTANPKSAPKPPERKNFCLVYGNIANEFYHIDSLKRRKMFFPKIVETLYILIHL
ncbi:uncharacterized protein LOC111086714 isoform X1 [Limulus polyphemus]|uniref:Uncharacterized protein LOC111086714 isoform X1 n=1 Tax=Limulus polyphemus TaxID=6850 RepID=A0ABM1SRW9_LIMPO|nr:uncharacterized protein LOC111086714 isoform X1 [Limulus polyphemus]